MRVFLHAYRRLAPPWLSTEVDIVWWIVGCGRFNVCGMNQFAAHVGAGNAIDLLGSFDAQQLVDAGANPTRVAD